ncbi:MAG TPA: hypothetical protein VF881_09035 [Polyangiaceae bacterium]
MLLETPTALERTAALVQRTTTAREIRVATETRRGTALVPYAELPGPSYTPPSYAPPDTRHPMTPLRTATPERTLGVSFSDAKGDADLKPASHSYLTTP